MRSFCKGNFVIRSYLEIRFYINVIGVFYVGDEVYILKYMNFF